MAVQVGHDRNDAVGGGANTFGDLTDGKNMVETLQDLNNISMKPNRSSGNRMGNVGNLSGPGNSNTESMMFRSPAQYPGWGQQES